MKDKATEWLMGLNPFDKVKGHTKIELTDVKTGKKQVIEKDNAFQAGVLASYMRSMGAYNNNPYANSTWAGQPIWRNLCGGIFCFKDPIDNSEDEVEYMPAGNEMVANGAYMVNNAGTPIELGSYNEVESSTSGNDSVTFVYDWMTHQGNGTISCVCLSTEIGGYIGYGNKSGVRAGGKELTANQNSAYRESWKVPYKNFLYRFTIDSANSKLLVYRAPEEVTKGSIFDNIQEDVTEITYSGTVSGDNSFVHAYYMGNGKIAVCRFSYNMYLNNGSTYSFIIYDAEAGTATVKTITNNTGHQLELQRDYGYADYSYRVQAITEEGFYAPSHSNMHIYRIDMTDNSYDDTEIVSVDGSNWDDYYGCQYGGMLSDGLMLFRDTSGAWIYDLSTKTKRMINSGSWRLNYLDWADVLLLNTSRMETYNHTPRILIYKNPLILSTINNLETPVTKTAAQTMKITYTLSKASE